MSRPRGWRGPRRLWEDSVAALSLVPEGTSCYGETCFSYPLPTASEPSEMLKRQYLGGGSPWGMACLRGRQKAPSWSPGPSCIEADGKVGYLVPLGGLPHALHLSGFQTFCCSRILLWMKSYSEPQHRRQSFSIIILFHKFKIFNTS